MLHLEITMPVSCCLLKASVPLFPLHTKWSRERKKNLGATWERKGTVVGASCLVQALFALCKDNPLENRSGWRCGKSWADNGELETGELGAVMSCSSSTSTRGLKYV